eukprot:TRINITY_DN75732_c0_g1_i1.p1 TRINITY_DN75732_c0_g1~~TRINITY_DN75732_c0_g1_i1.p1  ORF type:complete len:284 (+),score=21.48 TRINITY_DN75732_c0_g1_i1:86-853(+)
MRRLAETALALAIFPLRYGLITVAELVAFASCLTFDAESPTLRKIIAKMARVLIWGAGFLHIRTHGIRDDKAKLFVCNHASYMDGFLVTALLNAPSFVAKKEGMASLPMFGTIFDAMGLIYVDREHASSRKRVLASIMEHLRQDNARPLVIFPEGTIGASDHLLPFKLGAFRPGLPLQPVVIRYPRPRTGSVETPAKMFGLFLSIYHDCEVCYLPSMSPTEEEVKDPSVFAGRVKTAMEVQLQLKDWGFAKKKVT